MAKLVLHFHVVILLVISPLAYSSYADELFKNCDNVFDLNPGTTILTSPLFPEKYPAGSACRYRLSAPVDHTIVANCTIDMPTTSTSCSSDTFYVSTEGDRNFDDIIGACGTGILEKQAMFRDLALAFTSSPNGFRGRFYCELRVKPQACDCGWSASNRIVHGEEAGINEYPHMVALKDITSSSSVFCGGAIISPWYILTACHCAVVQPHAENIRALVGRHSLTNDMNNKYADEYGISQIIPHPYYDSYTLEYDIALMKVDRSIHYSRGVAPICLPPLNNKYGDFSYNDVDVIGFGTTSFAGPLATTLRKATLSILTNAACQNAYQNMANISDSQICTCDLKGTAQDSCQFDSGGPVMFRSNRMFLVGCISYGVACGTDTYPVGVNTRITDFLGWIYKNSEYSICLMSMD